MALDAVPLRSPINEFALIFVAVRVVVLMLPVAIKLLVYVVYAVLILPFTSNLY